MKRVFEAPRKRFSSDGEFINQSVEDETEFKTCKIKGTEIRVWGSKSGKGLNRELVSALRTIVTKIRAKIPIAIMADYHPAEFGVVGSVVPSATVIIPDLIGGDCGCGVYAVRLNTKLESGNETLLRSLYKMILARIPVGSSQNQMVEASIEELSIWDKLIHSKFVSSHEMRKLRHQLGSLGGGNHFIELARDEGQCVWLLIHSGSRFLGGILKEYYSGKSLSLVSDQSLEFLSMQQVVIDYARASRLEMATRVINCISEVFSESCSSLEDIDLVHNAVSLETHGNTELAIHRKGACTALSGALGIMPGSMGSNSYVVEGKGSPWSYNSTSHGAGRCMSRGDAFRSLSTRKLFSDMKGIVWADSERLKDEAPRAYKDIHSVIRAQRDLVRIVHRLTPFLVVKGDY